MLKRTFLILLFIISFVGCKNKTTDEQMGRINIDSIEILLRENHPTLREFKRILVVKNKNNIIISEVLLQNDIGRGCNGYLFNENESFLFIDCNSNWYRISKKNGEINLIGQFWMKDVPEKYIGTYKLSSKMNKVVFEKEKFLKKSEIYLYGGG